MNNNAMFALLYVSVISVAFFSSLYASHLNAWNHIVFTFPSETQKVIVNGTATMDIWWRWTPQSLEMTVKVNDDEVDWEFLAENYTRDGLALLFDSDHNGNLSTRSGYPDDSSVDDHGVFVGGGNNRSMICRHCYVTRYKSIFYPLACGFPPSDIVIVEDIENTYSSYTEGEGYTFHLNIPLELIGVEPPTPIYIHYFDGDYILWLERNGIPPSPGSTYEDEQYRALLLAEFEV